jgi:polar amino acid transport system permease protein
MVPENPTDQTPATIAGSLERARRLNVGGLPSAPTALFLLALVTVTLVVADSWYTIALTHSALRGSPLISSLVLAISALLALASILVTIPVIRAFRQWRDAHRALTRKDIAEARLARSGACEQSWVAMGYALAQLIIVGAFQFLLANHQAVAKTFFFVPLIVGTFALVLDAFWLNIELFLIAEIFVLVWGLVVALAMLAPGAAGKPVRLIATAYVDVFRAIPAVLVIYLVGFGIPMTGVPLLKDLSLPAYVIIALTLTVGAYVAEIYRAGIRSIHWSQEAAARSLGLSHMQSLRFVILPQAVRHIIPPLLNAFIALQKDTALVTVVGVIDSFNQSMVIAANHYNLSAVTTVALLFIVISIPQTRLVERMMKRDRARTQAGVV